MTLLHLVIAALAVARITSLIVDDSILEPIRHRVFLWSPPYDNPHRGYAYQQIEARYKQGKPHRPGPREAGYVGQLLSCTHCMGVWVAGIVYLAVEYLDSPLIMSILTIAALAQVSEATIKASR